jgi:hypothetical protein
MTPTGGRNRTENFMIVELISVINNPHQAVAVTSIAAAAAGVLYTFIDRVFKCKDAQGELEIPKD